MVQETELDDSCCCCKLKTGCVIIGCLFLIEALIYIIFNWGFLMILIIAKVYNDDAYYLLNGKSAIVVSSLMLLFSSLMVAFTIAMLVGVLSNKPGLVKKFLNYSVGFFMICFMYLKLFMKATVTEKNSIIYPVCILILLVKHCLRGAVKTQHEAMVKSANDTSPNDASPNDTSNENLEIEIYKDRSG